MPPRYLMAPSPMLRDLSRRINAVQARTPELAPLLRQALRALRGDPVQALGCCREALEQVLAAVYRRELHRDLPSGHDPLEDPSFTRRLERRIVLRMWSARAFVGLAPGAEPGPREHIESADAARALQDLCELLEWYLTRYPQDSGLLRQREDTLPEVEIDVGAPEVSGPIAGAASDPRLSLAPPAEGEEAERLAIASGSLARARGEDSAAAAPQAAAEATVSQVDETAIAEADPQDDEIEAPNTSRVALALGAAALLGGAMGLLVYSYGGAGGALDALQRWRPGLSTHEAAHAPPTASSSGAGQGVDNRGDREQASLASVTAPLAPRPQEGGPEVLALPTPPADGPAPTDAAEGKTPADAATAASPPADAAAATSPDGPPAHPDWSVLPTGTRTDLHALYGDGAGLLVAVGNEGLILRSHDHGRTWSRDPAVPTKSELLAISGTPGGPLTVVGAGGLLLRGDPGGATWRRLSTGTVNTLLSVHAESADEVYVAGDHGMMLHLGPAEALTTRQAGGDCLRALRRLGDVLYTVGDEGTILRAPLTGAPPHELRWQRVPSHTLESLWDIARGPDGYVVAGWQRPPRTDPTGYKRGLALYSADGLSFAPVVPMEPANPLYSIAVVTAPGATPGDASFLLAGIGRALLRGDGRSYHREASGALENLRGLPGKDLRFNAWSHPALPGHAYLVGRNGMILHRGGAL